MSSAQLDVAVNGSNSLQWGAISDDTETARLDPRLLFVLSGMMVQVKEIIQHRTCHVHGDTDNREESEVCQLPVRSAVGRHRQKVTQGEN